VSWQSIAVVLVVAAAVAFLVARAVGIRVRRKRPAQTFVPLSSLKKGKARK
jgi:hypothetical protein